MTTECRLCPGPLYPADILSGCDVCSECARRAIKASRRPPRERTIPKPHPSFGISAEDWSTFLGAVRSVVRDGEVHPKDLRPILRGVIEPKTLSRCYRRAKSEGLFVEAGHERSDDVAGGNTHRLEAFYTWQDVAVLAPPTLAPVVPIHGAAS